MNFPFVGPVAPESNPPIHPEFYNPSRFVITAISLGKTTTVTTEKDHDYVIGQLVRLLIPAGNKSRILNNRSGYVLTIPSSTQVEIDLDSSGATPFASGGTQQQPQIMAVGDINQGTINSQGRKSNGNFIPGSFIDVSP